MPLLTVKEIEGIAPVFKGKVGNATASCIRKVLGIAKLSDLYDTISDNEGADFAGALLKKIGVDPLIGYCERLLELPEGPFITISNHPYGGLDGVMLIDLMGHLRTDFKVVVNQFLTYIKALTPSLISVNPTTDKERAVTTTNIQGIREIIQNIHDGKCIGMFPSGAVSDLIPKEHTIRDREWRTKMIKVIRKANVPVIPIRFFDGNSRFYYNLGLIDWRIRVCRLPRELLNKAGTIHRIGIGKIISVEEQLRYKDIEEFKAFLRNSVYGMELPGQFTPLSVFRESL